MGIRGRTIRRGKIPLQKLYKIRPDLVVRDTNSRLRDRPEGDRYLTEEETRIVISIFYNRPIRNRLLRKWTDGWSRIGPDPIDIMLPDRVEHRFYDKQEIHKWLQLSEVCREHRKWGRYALAEKLETIAGCRAIPNNFKASFDLSRYNLSDPDKLPKEVRKEFYRQKRIEEHAQRMRETNGFEKLKEIRKALTEKRLDRLDKVRARRMHRRMLLHRNVED